MNIFKLSVSIFLFSSSIELTVVTTDLWIGSFILVFKARSPWHVTYFTVVYFLCMLSKSFILGCSLLVLILVLVIKVSREGHGPLVVEIIYSLLVINILEFASAVGSVFESHVLSLVRLLILRMTKFTVSIVYWWSGGSCRSLHGCLIQTLHFPLFLLNLSRVAFNFLAYLIHFVVIGILAWVRVVCIIKWTCLAKTHEVWHTFIWKSFMLTSLIDFSFTFFHIILVSSFHVHSWTFLNKLIFLWSSRRLLIGLLSMLLKLLIVRVWLRILLPYTIKTIFFIFFLWFTELGARVIEPHWLPITRLNWVSIVVHHLETRVG